MTGTLTEDRALRGRLAVFEDRKEAGQRLASLLKKIISSDELVLAIPSGGVPVAAEMAKGLGLALDLLIVRKIQVPWNTEAGFGAVAPDGSRIFNEDLLNRLNLTGQEVEAQTEK